MTKTCEFKNKIVVITGGSNGIGAAAAIKFAKNGAKVYVFDVKPLSYTSTKIEYVKCDVSSYRNVLKSVKKVISREKRIDYLFSNAGIHYVGTIEETSTSILDKIININLKGTLYIIKAIIPIMKKQNFGVIILNGSDQVFVGKTFNAIYGVTKGALGQLTKSLALDHAPYNIRVNCICPGAINTSILDNAKKVVAKKLNMMHSEFEEILLKHVPLNKIGQPNDVASLVLFLCSDDANFITGGLYAIDGGITAGSDRAVKI